LSRDQGHRITLFFQFKKGELTGKRTVNEQKADYGDNMLVDMQDGRDQAEGLSLAKMGPGCWPTWLHMAINFHSPSPTYNSRNASNLANEYSINRFDAATWEIHH
jgi:hypothetical protein